MTGTAPFDAVDLVLVTHHHRDHFAPREVARYLASHSATHLLTTPQAVAALRAQAGTDGLAERFTAALPADGRRQRLELGGVEVVVLNLTHGRERRPPVENAAFLVEVGEYRLLHVGDTVAPAADFAAYTLPREGIDVAFLPFWLLRDAPATANLLRHIAARHVVAMHLPRADAPPAYFGAENRDALIDTLRAAVPSLHILEPGEQLTLEPAPVSQAPFSPVESGHH